MTGSCFGSNRSVPGQAWLVQNSNPLSLAWIEPYWPGLAQFSSDLGSIEIQTRPVQSSLQGLAVLLSNRHCEHTWPTHLIGRFDFKESELALSRSTPAFLLDQGAWGCCCVSDSLAHLVFNTHKVKIHQIKGLSLDCSRQNITIFFSSRNFHYSFHFLLRNPT